MKIIYISGKEREYLMDNINELVMNNNNENITDLRKRSI
jgi:hypothetical protein